MVLPLTREWIEMVCSYCRQRKIAVLPLTREWIEIFQQLLENQEVRRSPSYEGVD